MKKTTKFILEGVKNENEKAFMNRIGELLERNNLLEVFANGVPVAAQICDEADFIEAVEKEHPNWHNITINNEKEMEISGGGTISIVVKYTCTRYYKTEEEAKEADWGGSDTKKDNYQYPGEHENSNRIIINGMPGVETLYV